MIHLRIFLVLIFSICILFQGKGLKAEGIEYDLKSYYPIKQGNVMLYTEKEEGNENLQKSISMTFGIEFLGPIPLHTIWKWESADKKKLEYELLCWIGMTGLTLYKEYRSVSKVEYYLEYDQPVILLPSKMSIGQTIEPTPYTYKWYDSGGQEISSGTEIIGLTLIGVEDITVKAGTFTNCLKFQREGSWDESDGELGEYKETFWLAEDVGMIKVIEEETEYIEGIEKTETITYELKKYFTVPIPLGGKIN
jgi:predicted transcriptional regulator